MYTDTLTPQQAAVFAPAPTSDPAPSPPLSPALHALETTLATLAAMDLAHAPDADVVRALELMVTHAEFPCTVARSIFRHGALAYAVLDDLESPDVGPVLLDRLASFARATAGDDEPHAFVATFRGPLPVDADDFTVSLGRLSARLGIAAPGGAPPLADPHVPIELGGTAYVVVALHPAAADVARRAPLPTLVLTPAGA